MVWYSHVFQNFSQFVVIYTVKGFGVINKAEIDVEKVETVTDFLFFGYKITADCDYSHEIKRHLLLGRKALTKLKQHFTKW